MRIQSSSTSPGGVAEWLCSGLQSRVRRFDSDLRLQLQAKRRLLAPFLFSPAAFMDRLCRPDVAGMLHYSCRTLFGGLRGLARGAACQSPSPIRDTPPACPGPLRHFPFFPVPMLLPMVAATVPR
ncbi:hypothetical protein CBM2634_A170211 [Cupriavidus taiwanensis]|uniref:Uncharacterized protein n=1 Tax=Cupriavidus taiwanensis TaxID=164546 RepID=A0A375IYR1_9BURK|nr:hypothetical protein CBM2634_A170211 [Cupriavidus taiwanensis]